MRIIARLNAGGPAHHVGILSSRLGPDYETLLVHGAVGADEAMLSDFDTRYPARRVEVSSLGRDIRPVQDLVTAMRLVRLMRRFRPDIVHTHTAKAGLVGRLAALVMRPRPVIVHTFHGHVLEGYFGRRTTAAYRSMERLLAAVSDCLVGVSDETVGDLDRFRIGSASSRRVIWLGLDLEPLLQAPVSVGSAFRREVGATDGETLVVAMGRLVPIKRYDLALEAFAMAREEGAQLRLAIVGAGERRAALEALAQRLGVAAHVCFTGVRGDVREIAAAADIALVTSDNEGTPVWLIEAAAAATPAVTTAAGGVATIVTPDTGIVVPRGAVAAVADALRALSDDPSQRTTMGRAARELVRERFMAERLLRDVDALYRAHLHGLR